MGTIRNGGSYIETLASRRSKQHAAISVLGVPVRNRTVRTQRQSGRYEEVEDTPFCAFGAINFPQMLPTLMGENASSAQCGWLPGMP